MHLQITADKTLTRRLLPEIEAEELPPVETKTPAKKSDLSRECESLVLLANPQDEFAMFDKSWQATGIATQAKYLESKFGLAVSGVRV